MSTRRPPRLLVAAALTGGVLLGVARPGAAQTWPDQDVYRGDQVTRSGTGCLLDGAPGHALLTLQDYHGRPIYAIGHAPAAPDGSWTVTATIGPGVHDGAFTIIGICAADPERVVVTDRPLGALGNLTVLREAPAAPATTVVVDAEAETPAPPPPRAVRARPTFTG